MATPPSANAAPKADNSSPTGSLNFAPNHSINRFFPRDFSLSVLIVIEGITGAFAIAFKAGFADGGVAILQLDESSILKKYGLKAGDLIQKINASKIKNITEMKAYLEANQKSASHAFFILRNQQNTEIKVNQILPVMDKN